jgi:transcriptional regulator with XRE-family HTH domain
LSTEASIGDRLDQLRRANELSQAGFASALGVSRTTLHNYARGEREMPAAVLAKLLELYRADPLWVLDGEEGIQSRETQIMDELGSILMQVEERLEERSMRLGIKKRWMIVCRLYTERIAEFRKTGDKPELQTLGLDELLDVAA